jgi:hypothetical protein
MEHRFRQSRHTRRQFSTKDRAAVMTTDSGIMALRPKRFHKRHLRRRFNKGSIMDMTPEATRGNGIRMFHRLLPRLKALSKRDMATDMNMEKCMVTRKAALPREVIEKALLSCIPICSQSNAI